MNINGLSYIKFVPLKANHAGNKAREDINVICQKNNLRQVLLISEKTIRSLKGKIFNLISMDTFRVIRTLSKIKGERIVLQYPFYINFIVKFFLVMMIKKNNIILLIHDIDALRNNNNDEIKKEVKILNYAKNIIVHNEAMKEKMQKIGVTSDMISLDIFDYILNDVPKNNSDSKGIVFAGNLKKSIFLNKINDIGLQINLYGPGYSQEIAGNNIKYMGSYDPNEIPYKIEGKYGLVWDGESIERCSGSVGEYMRYNNPHKMSLYIAAGMPVIVWKQAAIADFVLNNCIGIVVDDLRELKVKLKLISKNDYEEMKKNVQAIQKQVCRGYYTEEALRKSL